MAFLGNIKLVGVSMIVCGSVMMAGNSLHANATIPDGSVYTESVSELGIIHPLGTTEWRFKIENGNLYKRLRNQTTGQWIGDWILVGPV